MSSQSCVGHIEEQLAYHKGVVGIKVSLELNTAAVVFLSQETEAEDIREAVEHLGYNCSLIEDLGEKNDDLASETEKVTPDNNETSPLLKAKVSSNNLLVCFKIITFLYLTKMQYFI